MGDYTDNETTKSFYKGIPVINILKTDAEVSAEEFIGSNIRLAGTCIILLISLVLCFISLCIFIWYFRQHLGNYYEPPLQRRVCRFAGALPVLAIASFASCCSVLCQVMASDTINVKYNTLALNLVFKNSNNTYESFSVSYYQQQQLFIEFLKHLAQGLALCSFLSFIIHACGGYRCLTLALGCEGKPSKAIFPLNIIVHSFFPKPSVMRLMKVSVIQFAFTIPFCTLVNLFALMLKFSPDNLENYLPVQNTCSHTMHWTKGESIGTSSNTLLHEGICPIPQHSFVFTFKASSQLNEIAFTGIKNLLSKNEQAGKCAEAAASIFLSLSMFISMLALTQFYQVTHKHISPYKPCWKFLLVRVIMFTNAWQRFIISILFSFRLFDPPFKLVYNEATELIHNALMNLWVLIFTSLLFIAFPVSHHLPETALPQTGLQYDEKISRQQFRLLSHCIHTKPTLIQGLVDVFFSIDLFYETHEAVMEQYGFLERAYRSLKRENILQQSYSTLNTDLTNICNNQCKSKGCDCHTYVTFSADNEKYVSTTTNKGMENNGKTSYEVILGEYIEEKNKNQHNFCLNTISTDPPRREENYIQMPSDNSLFEKKNINLNRNNPYIQNYCKCNDSFFYNKFGNISNNSSLSDEINNPDPLLQHISHGILNTMENSLNCFHKCLTGRSSRVLNEVDEYDIDDTSYYRSTAARQAFNIRYKSLSSETSPYHTTPQTALSIASGEPIVQWKVYNSFVTANKCSAFDEIRELSRISNI